MRGRTGDLYWRTYAHIVQILDKRELQLRESTLPEAWCLFFLHFMLSKAQLPTTTPFHSEYWWGESTAAGGQHTYAVWCAHTLTCMHTDVQRREIDGGDSGWNCLMLISQHNVWRRNGLDLMGFINSLLVKLVLIKREKSMKDLGYSFSLSLWCTSPNYAVRLVACFWSQQQDYCFQKWVMRPCNCQ